MKKIRAVNKIPELARSQGPYPQHLIFSLVMKGSNKLVVLYYTKQENHSRDKHSSLLGLFVSYEENEVL
jgi:hypothetical protein